MSSPRPGALRSACRCASLVLALASAACAERAVEPPLDGRRGDPVRATSAPPELSPPTEVERLVASFDGQVAMVTMDGAMHPLLGPAELGGATDLSLETNGPYVLVRTVDGLGTQQLLARTDGALLRSGHYADAFTNRGRVLGDDGSVLEWQRSPPSLRIVAASGSTATLGGYAPTGFGARQGVAVVAEEPQPDGRYRVGFWSRATDTVTPIEGDVVAISPRAVLTQTEGDALVSRPGSSVRIAGGPVPKNVLRGERSGRWCFGRSGAATVVVFDLDAASRHEVGLQAPAGYRAATLCTPGGVPAADPLAIDAAGRIYQAFRTDDHVAVFRTLDGAVWERIGAPLTRIHGIDVRAVGETVVVLAEDDTSSCFGADGGGSQDAPTFAQADADALVGSSLQLVRDGRDVVHLGRVWLDDAQVSDTGRHAAFWADARLVVVDVEHGVDMEIPGASAARRGALCFTNAVP